MVKKNIYVIVVTLAIISIAGWFFATTDFKQNDVTTAKSDIVQDLESKDVALLLDDGEGTSKIITATFVKGMTAFSLLKQEVEKLPLALKTKNYNTGVFIEAIGEKENGQGGKYWLYYVNGSLPMISSDKKEIKAGDKVEFKFEKSPL